MKKVLLTGVIALGVPLCLQAVQVDGINYALNGSSRTCSVARSTVSGDIAIPATIDASGTTYTVTAIEASAFDNCRELTGIEIPASVTSVGNEAFDNCVALKSVVISDSETSLSLGYNYSGSYKRGQFYNCPIESLYLGRNLAYSPVSSYDYSPFNGRNNISSITIGDKVTEIGNDLFREFSELATVSLPSGVRSIGNGAFRGCSKLTGLVLPAALTSIGSSAFYGCESLAAMEIPAGVSQLGSSAFYGCSKLESVALPAALETIGGEAFYNCISLKSVALPAGITTLANSLFRGCSSLATVSLPGDIETINAYVFYGCSALEAIEIPAKVTSIGNYAFKGCSALKHIVFADGLGTVDLGYYNSYQGLFYDCPVKTLHVGRSLAYDPSKGYSPFYGHEPATLTIGDKVTKIGDNFFRGFTNLTSVELPEALTEIGASAFYGCSALVEIEIPGNVTSVGNNAFNGCGVLKKVVFADGDTELALGYNSSSNKGLFYDSPISELYVGRTLTYSADGSYDRSPLYGRDKIEQITIGDKVTGIGDYFFYGLSTLTSIDLPTGLRTIGTSAFEGCNLLSAIALPDSLRSIGNSAFNGCSKFESLTLPDKLTSIGSDAFNGCSSVKTIVISDGDGILNLGNTTVFADCPIETLHIGRGLSYTSNGNSPFCEPSKALTIGDKVTNIPPYLFKNFKQLTSIRLSADLTAIGTGAFYGCSALTAIEIPAAVTEIGDYAFNGCTGLKSLVISDGVKSLRLGCNEYSSSSSDTGKGLFADCPLETVHLGRNLSYSTGSYSGYSPLYGQAKVTEVTVGDNVTEIGDNLFKGMTALTAIKMPASVKTFGGGAFSGCSGLTELALDSGDGWNKVDAAFDDTHFAAMLVTGTTPDVALKIGDSEAWASFRQVGYKADGKHYVPVYWNMPLTAAKSISANETGCLVDKDEIAVVSAMENDHYVVMFRGEDVSAQVASAEGFSFDPKDGRYQNRFTVYGSTGDKVRTVALKKAGELFNTLGLQNIQSIETLILSGDINGTDVMTINRMPLLRNLDLRDANIVAGGETYRDDLQTADDVVGSYFFYSTGMLENVMLPRSATEIAANAFLNNDSLVNVLIGENVERIAYNAFGGCVKLAAINIPASVTEIGYNPFDGCKSLVSVRFEDSNIPLSIGLYYDYSDNEPMFADSRLESAYIGRNIAGSYDYGYGNNGYRHYYRDYKKAPFYNQVMLRTAELGDSVSYIGHEFFYGCKNLEEIAVPDNVREIDYRTFSGCSSLKNVRLGKCLTHIAEDAFRGCSAISEIRSLNHLPPVITTEVFADVDKEQCKLVVTKGNLVNYWLDPVWKEFMNMTDDILDLSPLPPARYGDAPVDLASYAPEGVALSYESSNPEVARIDGSMLTICGAGEATIGAINPDQGTAMEVIGLMRQFKVSKADLEVAAPEIEIVQGDDMPEFELSYSGFCYNDTFADLEETPVATCDATSMSEPGEYSIELSGGHDRNYNLTLTPGILRIKMRQSGVDMAASKGFKCTVFAEAVILTGLQQGDVVEIYTLDGSLYIREQAQGDELRVPVAGRSFYIVRAKGETHKIFVK